MQRITQLNDKFPHYEQELRAILDILEHQPQLNDHIDNKLNDLTKEINEHGQFIDKLERNGLLFSKLICNTTSKLNNDETKRIQQTMEQALEEYSNVKDAINIKFITLRQNLKFKT
ncbi:unnamed protein product [Didymodactylos carnosus]|uniref:Uncharacterized protein n=1 Tax=Didymodactylos carnosus TaxID=1234261 RepID=A0A815UN86_9BILA|nr:unnamed protein product [Didymodactylos carnosus]CAF1518381.1 unnamed protein product [Didymodactylos carnosus]CAF4003625.1 unnamed protein product [Didymodactylos carnosus]CAF4378064.1 unnamed protein product [Didymodactylos carnosus]